MTRLKQGALLMKLMSAVMATSLFITPMAWAQANTPADSVVGSQAEASPSKGELTFQPTDELGQSQGKRTTKPVEVKADTDTPSETSSSAEGSDGKSAEETGAAAGVADGTAVADSTGGSTAKRLDPTYNTLPKGIGEGKVRKAFKLFAKEELIHNLSFRDTPIKEVVAELARRGNLNVILDKSVFGKITGDLHDVTLNEAMDAVLASAGLQSRVLDSNTAVIGTPNSLNLLGLNRTHYKVFKLSYITAFDIANILFTSVFNRGLVPDFTNTYKTRFAQASSENPKTATQTQEESQSAGIGEGGAQKRKDGKDQSSNNIESKEEQDAGSDYTFNSRLDGQRILKGTTRVQTQEGTGFNNAAQDPGTEQIRAFQEVATDYTVEQNGGGALVVPDARNRQVVVVGTPDDIAVAEECIRLLDRRPKQVHVQVSLVELNNAGIRVLGASLNLQGQGASGALLGGSGAPLINQLPGLGSGGSTFTQVSTSSVSNQSNLTAIANPNNTGQVNFRPAGTPGFGLPVSPVLGTFTNAATATSPAGTGTAAPQTDYAGILGGFLPAALAATIAGVTSSDKSANRFNFLALNKAAGGRNNIATVPMGLNLTLNMILQQNKAKLLANPSVIVSDNTEALVTLASEVIHKVTSTVSLGVTNVNVELTKAGIFLDVLPKCSEDGFIYMRIRPQVSSPLGPPQTFANQQVIVTLLNIREIMAQEIRVKDGQTLVLGGLFTEQEAAQISKVPYLAETPLFGALFRHTLKGRQRTELMLMITPKVVEEQPSVPPIAESAPGGPSM